MKHPLQIWRESKKLSQPEAAAFLGCSQGAISHIETGRNSISKETAKAWENKTGNELKYADLVLFEFPPERFKKAA